MLPTVKDLAAATLTGRRVWLRVDWNVALAPDGRVSESYRIDRTLETIRLLQAAGAKLVIGTHLSNLTQSLEPVLAYARSKVDLAGAKLLPNLRTLAGEKENDPALARQWAASADLYVNEAFAASHRAHASILGLPALLPAYAGNNFALEVKALSACFQRVSPTILIIGGGKIESKRPVLDKFLPLVDQVVVGGALVNDFLNTTDQRIVISSRLTRVDGRIVDVLPDELIARLVKTARRIIWAGPMGMYDHGYSQGTLDLARAIAESDAESIVGGGDTVAAVSAEVLARFTFVSTGGGAMLQFLATGTLPGIEALKR